MRQALLTSPDFGPLRLAMGRMLYWRYRLFVRRKHEDVVLEQVGGQPLVVMPGVLNPRWMRTGAFFASQLSPTWWPAGAEVLDLGSGSGVCAVAAARYARHVVAVDINPQAVRCTRINVLLNRIEDRVEVLRGDLFAPLGARRFDAVLFNPPFLRREPRDDADRAWASSDVAERFAAGLRDHLKPGGAAFLLLSSFGGAQLFLDELRKHHFAIEPHAAREYVNERVVIFRVVSNPRLP